MVFLLTVVLCCVMMEGLNPGPALFCVEFAGAPSMCSSVSSHSLKTSVCGCCRPCIPYWSQCFSDHSADPSSASASNTSQSEMSRQIWTVYGNLECLTPNHSLKIGVLLLMCSGKHHQTPVQQWRAERRGFNSACLRSAPVTQWLTHKAVFVLGCCPHVKLYKAEQHKDNKRSKLKLPCLNKLFWLTFCRHACWD